MPIIKDGEQAREIMVTISREGRSLPCYGTESVYTTEAIFKGVKAYKENNNIKGRLPFIIAFTASYADRQQLKNYTGLADFRAGMAAVKSDIERLSDPAGPYHDLDVIVHLDHAQPGADDWILEEYGDFIASVMWDCSYYAMKDNISMTKKFTEENRSRFLIEGAVDEIYNYSSDNKRGEVVDNISDPSVAERFFHETGCDLIVANLGTEHRRTEGTVKYHRDVAREITSRIGRKLVLHGTSSLSSKDLSGLAGDGIVKVNLWGKMESEPGKKLAMTLIRNLQNILSKEQIEDLVEENLLHPSLMEKDFSPSIHYLTEKYRRDEIYLPETVRIVRETFKNLYIGS